MLPSNASPRPAAVNDNVRQGTALQTGAQSRSELTFKDQTITRLGEKTIFSVGEGARTIDLGSRPSFVLCSEKSGCSKGRDGPRHRSYYWVNKFPATWFIPDSKYVIALRCRKVWEIIATI